MRTVSFLVLGLALALTLTHTGRATAQPKGKALTPLEHYAKFRATMSEGKFDIAGLFLEDFLKSIPDEAELSKIEEKAGTDVFLKLEEKHGTTVFQMLRTVPKYSDDPATEKKIRDNIEDLNRRAAAVSKKLLQSEARVKKFIRNLGETYEEKVFAQQELKRTGEYAIPYLLKSFSVRESQAIYDGILDTIPVLEGATMAGWVAALDALPPDRQYGVLSQLAKRRDVLTLISDAQTDFTPYLWRIMSKPRADSPTLYDLAQKLHNDLFPGQKADAKRPEVELVALARKFYDHKARYLGAKSNQDGSPTLVPLWVASAPDGVFGIQTFTDVPVGQAEEYYGLRYARWALEMKPDYEPAQSLVLSLASERAVERSRAGNLAVSEPAVYKLLADAPSQTLINLLTRGMNENRTTLVFAMIQVLGDRADRAAATPPAGAGNKPSLFVRALSYPDHSVQFAAATALLRSPVPVPASAKPQIVEILRRAAGTDPGKLGESRGTVLLADPTKFRAEQNALLLRGFGFEVEQFTTGRELMKRIAKASDFDLIFIDHHTPNPELIDLISQVTSDVRTAARPVFVIASPDKPRVPSFDQLLLRTAALIAATENDILGIPSPYVADPERTLPEQVEDRKGVLQKRDAAFRSAAQVRSERLQRVIDTLPLTLNENQKRLLGFRIQTITYSLLGAEFPITPESAPETVVEIDRLRKQISLQPPSAAYGTTLAVNDLMKLIERYELDVQKVKGAQDKYDKLRARVDVLDAGLTIETFRDPVIEARVSRTLKGYPAVKIIPEPYSKLQLDAEFKVLFADPMMIPRDASLKKADAKTAVDFLRQMAVGDLPGYEFKLADAELRAAVNHPDPDVASSAVDAVERFKTGDAQVALLQLATKKIGNVPIALRRKAADAVIRHVRANKPMVTPDLVTEVIEQTKPDTTPDAELRAKFLTLKGMLAFRAGDFTNDLKGYNPPIMPVAPPKKDPEPEPKKDPPPP